LCGSKFFFSLAIFFGLGRDFFPVLQKPFRGSNFFVMTRSFQRALYETRRSWVSWFELLTRFSFENLDGILQVTQCFHHYLPFTHLLLWLHRKWVLCGEPFFFSFSVDLFSKAVLQKLPMKKVFSATKSMRFRFAASVFDFISNGFFLGHLIVH